VALVFAGDFRKIVERLGPPRPDSSPSTVVADGNARESSPIPSPSLLPSTHYQSKTLNLNFDVPSRAYKISEYGPNDYGEKDVQQWHLPIYSVTDSSSPIGTFTLIKTSNDRPFAWEGMPTWYIGSLEKANSLETLKQQLKDYYINAEKITPVRLENIQATAYIIYGQACHGGCFLVRMYLIPYERYVDSNLYHTLTFSSVIDDLGGTDEEINANMAKYHNADFDESRLPRSVKDKIDQQDSIIRSLRYN
jgi:hypothetical protein